MRTKLSKIAHILLILLIGGIGVQTITSCSGGDGGGGGNSSPSSIIDYCDTLTYAMLPPCEGGTVEIGTQIWQKCNLNVEPSTGNSRCYCDKPENCDKYGRLYDWEAAKSACPTGFHLPTNEEWNILVNYAGGVSGAGKKLKATSGWDYLEPYFELYGNDTDDYGFSALPGGRYDIYESESKFDEIGSKGHWWSATEYDASIAYIQGMTYYLRAALSYFGGKHRLQSVRCIQD